MGIHCLWASFNNLSFYYLEPINLLTITLQLSKSMQSPLLFGAERNYVFVAEYKLLELVLE